MFRIGSFRFIRHGAIHRKRAPPCEGAGPPGGLHRVPAAGNAELQGPPHISEAGHRRVPPTQGVRQDAIHAPPPQPLTVKMNRSLVKWQKLTFCLWGTCIEWPAIGKVLPVLLNFPSNVRPLCLPWFQPICRFWVVTIGLPDITPFLLLCSSASAFQEMFC